jgi:hypothetical protein
MAKKEKRRRQRRRKPKELPSLKLASHNWGKLTLGQLSTRVSNFGVNFRCEFTPTPAQMKILSRGLKFLIKPPPINLNTIYSSINDTVRKVRIHEMFKNRSVEKSIEEQKFKLPNLNFLPELANAFVEKAIEELYQATNNYIDCFGGFKKKSYNISKKEASAIKELQENNKIIIKPADKNLGITILDKEWYEKECYLNLNNKNNYCKIAPIWIGMMIPNIIAQLKNALHVLLKDNKYLYNYLLSKSEEYTIPDFYIIPKLHKPILAGRPIVAGHSWILAPLSRYIAFLLQPILKNSPRFLDSSQKIISEIENVELNKEFPTFLITGDVENMYPNIPINEAIEKLAPLLHNQNSRPLNFSRLLKILLKYNIMKFNGEFFLQLNGVAMGTPAAPQIASLFMDLLEAVMWLNLSQRFGSYLKIWKRYIDDILIIWNGPEDYLLEFLDNYNKIHNNIKIVWKRSPWICEFLDLNLLLMDNRIIIRSHEKVFNKFLYIPFQSYHPVKSKRGWIKAELLRHARNNTYKKDFLEMKNKFFIRLLARGYPSRFLKPVFDSVKHCDKLRILSDKREKEKRTVIPLILPFNPRFDDFALKYILNSERWRILQKSSFPRIVLAWRKPSSLYNKLIRAEYPPKWWKKNDNTLT